MEPGLVCGGQRAYLRGMSRQVAEYQGGGAPRGVRVAIAAARFNGQIVQRLLTSCRQRLAELGVDEDGVEICQVPGAFELPLAAQALARRGRVAAVICLGAVVRGQTPHFDFVAGQCAAGLARVGLDHGLPVIFGVLTTNTRQQALDRSGGRHGDAGRRAAEAAIEMIAVLRKIQGNQQQHPHPNPLPEYRARGKRKTGR